MEDDRLGEAIKVLQRQLLHARKFLRKRSMLIAGPVRRVIPRQMGNSQASQFIIGVKVLGAKVQGSVMESSGLLIREITD